GFGLAIDLLDIRVERSGRHPGSLRQHPLPDRQVALLTLEPTARPQGPITHPEAARGTNPQTFIHRLDCFRMTGKPEVDRKRLISRNSQVQTSPQTPAHNWHTTNQE